MRRIFIIILITAVIGCTANKQKMKAINSDSTMTVGRINQQKDSSCKKVACQKVGEIVRYYLYTMDDGYSLDQSRIIELRCAGDSVKGWFWGTTDEFVTAREGYAPGFYVLGMNELKLIGDSIFFNIDSDKEPFFGNQLNINYHSSKEAMAAKEILWDNNDMVFWCVASYKGVVSNDSIILYSTSIISHNYPHENVQFDCDEPRVFHNVTRDSLLRIKPVVYMEKSSAECKKRRGYEDY